MPIARFQMPDGRVARFEVPDGTSPEQAQTMMEAHFNPAPSQPKYDPTTFDNGPLKIGKEGFSDSLRETLKETDWGTRNIAGAGTALSDAWQGIKQLVGKGDQQAIENNKIIQEEAPIGSIAGNIALTAVPFAKVGTGVKAAGAVGAGVGALQPVAGEQSLENIAKGKLLNSAIGTATGIAGQSVANKAGNWISGKVADLALRNKQNAPINQSLRESVEAGYQVPPSLMPDSSTTSRLLEGLSGKYKTNQLAGIRNQEVTDNLARKSVGLAPDAPLTSETLQQVRKQAYQTGYAPIEGLGQIKTDSTFAKSLDSLVSSRKAASNSFPNAVKDEITPVVESLKVDQFDAGDAMKMTQLLRDEANAAYRSGDNALGAAKKGAAKAIEDQIERHLSAQGQNGTELLKGFRDARTLMAKAHTLEDAVREGGGKVDAKKLGSRLQSGKPLTDEQKIIGQFANNFGDVAAIPKSGNANPLTALDFMQGGGVAALGGGPLALALPAARIGARYGLLSKPAQGLLSTPKTAISPSSRVAGGLLKYSPSTLTALGLAALD